MQTMTVSSVMALRPCEDYPVPRVTALWAGRDAITPAEAAALDIPAQDRVWLLVRWSGITHDQRVRFACDCAERVLPLFEAKFPGDARPRKAIEAARRGDADATYAAADAAADATYAAAAAAADATYAAADAAAAARKAEREWQVTRLVAILSE